MESQCGRFNLRQKKMSNIIYNLDKINLITIKYDKNSLKKRLCI
jgi:hypothetical protein